MQKFALQLVFGLTMTLSASAQVENLAEQVEATAPGSLAQDAPAAAAPGEGPSRFPNTAEAPPIVVTASPLDAADPFSLPYSLETVPAFDPDSPRAPRTIIDALGDLPSVTAQRTAYGQGSPFLRGYTSFRTLVLVDGIRINHAAQREGPNQYTSLVDPFIVERAEVVYGPSSVLYGSDAIGGTINFITRSEAPSLNPEYGGRLVQRFASAENSSVTRAEFRASNTQAGVLLGGAFRDYDDLSGGRHLGLQRNTGYTSWSGDAKLLLPLSAHTDLLFAYQRHEQIDVPRTHSTIFGVSYRGTAVGTDLRRDLTQRRELVYGKLLWNPSSERSAEFRVSHQFFDEQENRVRSNGRNQVQGFDNQMIATSLQYRFESAAGNITLGGEYQTEGVDSFLRVFQPDGSITQNGPRGPVADQATVQTLGLFVQDRVDVHDDLALTLGGRATWVHVDADEVDPDPSDATPFESVNDTFSAVVGSARALYRAAETTHFFVGISQGFRAPNLSDLTRFDISRSGEQEIPAPDLDPEYYATFEIGSKVRCSHFEGSLTYHYTWIDDMILRFPTGATNADGDAIVTKANVGDGYSQGVELQASWFPHPEWTVYGGFGWVEGQTDVFLAPGVEDEETFSKLPPAAGLFGVRYHPAIAPLQVEADVRMANNQDRLSSRDVADTQRIPAAGTPGFSVFGCRARWQAYRKGAQDLSVTVGVENITDRDYRIHGSGSNEPGTNFVITLDWRF